MSGAFLATDAPDVLIVGGGPVGLGLAIELGRRGVKCLVVEKGDGVVREAKMFAVGVRTMEICRSWGIAPAIRAWGFPEDHPFDNAFVTSLAGFEMARIPMPSMSRRLPFPQTPEGFVHCPQFAFDPFLLNLARSLPSVRIEHGVEALDIGQDDAEATARLRFQDGDEQLVRAQYLVGCDGFHSAVRECAGIAMSGDDLLGRSINITFSAPGLRAAHDKAAALRYVIVGPNGPWASLVAADGKSVWRLMVQGRAAVEPARANPAAAIRKAIGRDDVEFEIISVGPWTRRHMVADAYRRGRIFLAGDAVHVMPPNGGLGMNTGLADVHNLGWKLAAVVQGWGGEDLLESYEAERRPAGVHACAEAMRNFDRYMPRGLDFSRILEADDDGAAMRREVGDELFRANSLAWEDPLGVHLGFVYDHSPVCISDDAPSPPLSDDPRDYVQQTTPGARAPHVALEAERSTLDAFGDGFTLVCRGGAATERIREAAAARRIPLTTLVLEEAQAGALYPFALTLVRPDGHVAWRGEQAPLDLNEFWARVTGFSPSRRGRDP